MIAPQLHTARSPVALPDEHLLPLFRTVTWFPPRPLFGAALAFLGWVVR